MIIKNNRTQPSIFLRKAGFTVIEVLVSLSIMTFIMSTVLFNYTEFNDNLALSAASEEIAIAVRQAQTYGLTVKEVSGGNFDSAYGVYFDFENDPTNYYIFADAVTVNGKYDVGSGCGSGSTECVERFSLRNGIRITSICDGALPCTPPIGAKKLNVTFLRPDPDATILFTNTAGATVAGPSFTSKVVLTSNRGGTVTLTIESTGQVSVK